jgi:ABC-2 type transport system ATP-binding protein
MEHLVITGLSKVIKGKEILKNINLTLEYGKVYGLVGRNGSGKTMLFRALSGLIRPTSGQIFVKGKELYKEIENVENLGIVIENAGLYPEFSGFENLKFLAEANCRIGEAEIRQAITKVGLDPDDKRTVKKYSLGMKQRIVIAQAIMEKPDLLLLDEPTNALDESGIEMVHDIIKAEAQRGALVILASHSREDIKLLCEQYFVMKEGALSDSKDE